MAQCISKCKENNNREVEFGSVFRWRMKKIYGIVWVLCHTLLWTYLLNTTDNKKRVQQFGSPCSPPPMDRLLLDFEHCDTCSPQSEILCTALTEPCLNSWGFISTFFSVILSPLSTSVHHQSQLILDHGELNLRQACTLYTKWWCSCAWLKIATQLLAPGLVIGHFVLYVCGKCPTSELYMIGVNRGEARRLWNTIFCNLEKQRGLSGVISHLDCVFAQCILLSVIKKKKIFSVLIFRSLYCIFDHLLFWFWKFMAKK